MNNKRNLGILTTTLALTLGACTTPRRNSADELRATIDAASIAHTTSNSSDVNYSSIVDLAQRLRVYEPFTAPITSGTVNERRNLMSSQVSIADVDSSQFADLSALKSGLQRSVGDLYIFINGHKSITGRESDVQTGYWAFRTQVTPQDLARIISPRLGENAATVPQYLTAEQVINLCAGADFEFRHPPVGRRVSREDWTRLGYVPVLDTDAVERLLEESGNFEGINYPNGERNSQLFTRERHVRMLECDRVAGSYEPELPALLYLVIREAPAGTLSQRRNE